MDLMAIRRGLMAQVQGVNTSPIILQYNVRYIANGGITEDDNCCITNKYYYDLANNQMTLGFYGVGDTGIIMLTYNNNGADKMDYWSLKDSQSPRLCINAGSDAMAFSLSTSMLDSCYAYIVETGQILFAGRNSIYYGHRNISELTPPNNYLDGVSWVTGKYISSSGSIGSSSAFMYSDLVNLGIGTYRFTGANASGTNDATTRIHKYNSNGEWVSQIAYQSKNSGQQYDIQFEIQDSSANIRISTVTNLQNGSLEKV